LGKTGNGLTKKGKNFGLPRKCGLWGGMERRGGMKLNVGKWLADKNNKNGNNEDGKRDRKVGPKKRGVPNRKTLRGEAVRCTQVKLFLKRR